MDARDERTGEQNPDPGYRPRLLGFGGERRGEEHRTRASKERVAIYEWVLPQRVCESGARGCGAWGNRVESMQEPSLQAGRQCSGAKVPAGGTIQRHTRTSSCNTSGQKRGECSTPIANTR